MNDPIDPVEYFDAIADNPRSDWLDRQAAVELSRIFQPKRAHP